MLGRFVIGIIKGLFIGGLIGFGLAKIGFVAPGAFMAYLAAAITGVVVGLFAGKPIWAKDARIEAGMKAVVGALLGAGMMFAARRWLTFGMPFDLGDLSQANQSLGETTANGTFGGLAVTSLAAIAALLGGFYDADNTPEPDEEEAASEKSSSKATKNSNVRVAAASDDEVDEEVDEAPAEKRRRR